jgi:hypothetical protein
VHPWEARFFRHQKTSLTFPMISCMPRSSNSAQVIPSPTVPLLPLRYAYMTIVDRHLADFKFACGFAQCTKPACGSCTTYLLTQPFLLASIHTTIRGLRAPNIFVRLSGCVGGEFTCTSIINPRSRNVSTGPHCRGYCDVGGWAIQEER